MCSYKLFEGDWACENDWLLNHVLKETWNYPGFVLSDWEATHSTVKAANAGLDMEQPGDIFFGSSLRDAVQSGRVSIARLDNMVHRILRSMFAEDVIDHPTMPRVVVDPFRGRDDARRIANESIVLLKNYAILPLDAKTIHSIAVIGARADVGVVSGGGSAQVDAPGGNTIHPGAQTQWGKPVYFPTPPLRFIREHAPSAKVQFDPGSDLAAAADLARKSDVAIVFADQYMSESQDALTLSLPNHQDDLIRAVAAANSRTIVVLITGNPVTMPWVDRVEEGPVPGASADRSQANAGQAARGEGRTAAAHA